MQQVMEIGGKAYKFSRHAIERALDMDIDPAQIRQALEHPENVGHSPTYGTTNYHFGDITLAVVEGAVCLIQTILWRTDELWRRDLSRGGYGGRTLRK